MLPLWRRGVQRSGPLPGTHADRFRVSDVYILNTERSVPDKQHDRGEIESLMNRIVKVLLASVTPGELMMGKILGISLSGLTTVAVWLLSFFLFITLYQSSHTELVGQILNLSSALN